MEEKYENINYRVPEVDDETQIKLVGDKVFTAAEEAKTLGIMTRPMILGPFPLLKLASYQGTKRQKIFMLRGLKLN